MFLCSSCVFLIWTLAVLTAAQPVCDVETQYLRNGECCQKCGPGTSMESNVCRSPVCTECGENEYTDTYNTEPTCGQQPYCDPNLNFQMPKSTSKTQRHTCLCEEGFHCSSPSCINCVPHSECDPGFGAKIIGGQTQDTQCEKCPDGTFSDETSWNGTCKKMTECPSGYEPQGGSRESDYDCVFQRTHIGLICAILILIVIGAGGIFLYRYKNKTGLEVVMNPPTEYKHPVEEDEHEEEEGKKTPIIASPTDDREPLYFPGQETGCNCSIPVEDEYRGKTTNGHALAQDNKEHKISIPDTEGMDSGSEFNSI